MLGAKYYGGRTTGIRQDYVLSYKWVNLAADGGDQGAVKLLDILKPLMSQEQIAEGQRLAEEFKAKKAR